LTNAQTKIDTALPKMTPSNTLLPLYSRAGFWPVYFGEHILA